MSEPPSSPLTVAKLKALCILNDLKTSGNKADLVERLLKSGVSPTDLGIEETVVEDVIEEVEEEFGLSLEDEETITPTEEKVEEEPLHEEDEILEAEVFEAELIDDISENPLATEIEIVQQKPDAELATLLEII